MRMPACESSVLAAEDAVKHLDIGKGGSLTFFFLSLLRDVIRVRTMDIDTTEHDPVYVEADTTCRTVEQYNM